MRNAGIVVPLVGPGRCRLVRQASDAYSHYEAQLECVDFVHRAPQNLPPSPQSFTRRRAPSRVNMNQGECMLTVYRVLVVLAAVCACPRWLLPRPPSPASSRMLRARCCRASPSKASSPELIEKVRTAVDGRHRPVSASSICGRAPTPSPSRSRASTRVHREGIELTGTFVATVERRDARRRARGDRHRHRRIAHRRRAERPPAGDGERRGHRRRCRRRARTARSSS